MFSEWKKILFVAIMALLLTAIITPPTQAVWHVFLDEHFDKDQQNQNLRWPWLTDLRVGLRWHWNPRPPHFRAEAVPTDYSWGIQDYIYNSRVTPRHELHQALWCAYTNRTIVNEPHWPADDDYMPLQNAWVWWGPVSLENAVSANVSFWVYIDLSSYPHDSLSCVAVDDPELLTLEGDDFFETVPVGKSFSHRISNDWLWQSFYLDSLYVAGGEEPVSVLGSEEVYIAFVWHSGRYVLNDGDKGAFVDDVIFAWDDGLFDIVPTYYWMGYRVNEDQIDWSREAPGRGEEVSFKVDYKVIGVGDSPEFDIQLLHNDTLMYSETVTQLGSEDSTYTITADTVWTAYYGYHQFRWELDIPVREGGNVEEGNENNNVKTWEFSIEYNPAPGFDIEDVAETDTVIVNGEDPINIAWTIADTLNDFYFNVYLYWTEDTTGLADDPEVYLNYGYVGRAMNQERGDGSFAWDADHYLEELADNQFVYIVGFATDGYPGNHTITVAPDRYAYHITSAVDFADKVQPSSFDLNTAYPNPFNSDLRVEFTLGQTDHASLAAFDMAGRQIATLFDGIGNAGVHQVTWQPQDMPAGVYLLRLESAGKSALQKVVYMP